MRTFFGVWVRRRNSATSGSRAQYRKAFNIASTASDIARLLQVAADNTLIRDITSTPSYFFASGRRLHQVVNTNRLLHSRFCEVNCGKTGFISEAGYCLATWVRTRGRDLIAVVLGAPTNATRFADVVRLMQRTTTSSVAAEARQ